MWTTLHDQYVINLMRSKKEIWILYSLIVINIYNICRDFMQIYQTCSNGDSYFTNSASMKIYLKQIHMEYTSHIIQRVTIEILN